MDPTHEKDITKMTAIDRRNGATNKNGQKMKAGDKVRCMFTGKTGTADEFLQDGDASVSWDDGSGGMPKWWHLEPA